MSANEEENILAKEIKSWKGFEHPLREPNAISFNKMLKECLENEEYASALKTKGPQYSALFLVQTVRLPKRLKTSLI